jgi:hypothetical protein
MKQTIYQMGFFFSNGDHYRYRLANAMLFRTVFCFLVKKQKVLTNNLTDKSLKTTFACYIHITTKKQKAPTKKLSNKPIVFIECHLEVAQRFFFFFGK